MYLTSGYDGAPFGLLVVNAGGSRPVRPGHGERALEDVNVDPNTAQVTITTDPGPW